jgi:uncharacterized protein YdaU (DUF1376 family)
MNMKSKSPAFQFYPQDYLSSARVAEMTLEEEGVYIRLLCYCWSSGSIPADPERCARLAGKGCSTTVATAVQRAFNEHPTDSTLLVHDRLDVERENQRIRREQASEAGKKSAEVRAVNRGKSNKNASVERPFSDRSTTVQRKSNTSSSSSSSSSSLSFTESDEETANYIWDQIHQSFPSQRKPNLQSWADTIRLMRERDELADAEIRRVFDWAHEDSFWRPNILSPKKLREKWNVLEARADTPAPKPEIKPGTPEWAARSIKWLEPVREWQAMANRGEITDAEFNRRVAEAAARAPE